MDNPTFLQWIHDRLVNVHDENPNFDYMHRLRQVILEVTKSEEHAKWLEAWRAMQDAIDEAEEKNT